MKTCILLSLCSFSFFIAACSNSSGGGNSFPLPPADEFSKMVIAFFPPQGLGDSSDVDNLYSGIFQACKESDGQLEMLEVVPDTWENCDITISFYLKFIKDIQESDESAPDFLFLFYEGYLPFLEEFSKDFEGTKITVLLFESKKSNLSFVKRVSIPLYGASYLAGLCSKELLKDKSSPRVLSILANSSDQSLRDAAEAFATGFNPSPSWDGKIYSGWNDSDAAPDFYVMSLKDDLADGGYNQSSALYLLMNAITLSSPYDLLFPLCRGSISGITKFIREKVEASPYTVGSYTDLNGISSRIPFSLVKHTGLVAKECLLRWVNGEELEPLMEFGLKDGYTELVISKDYSPKLSKLVEDNFERAVELEREHEDVK